MSEKKFDEKITPELIEKAKATKTGAELRALLDEAGLEMTEEDVRAYYAMMTQQSCELSDEELDNVSGGCSEPDGRECFTM